MTGNPIETQGTISQWGYATFGETTTREMAKLAADEMMKELLPAIEADPKAQFYSTQEEAADVAIFLMRLAAVSGFNLQAAVNRKMAINRQRKWVKQEDGTWIKVKEAAK